MSPFFLEGRAAGPVYAHTESFGTAFSRAPTQPVYLRQVIPLPKSSGLQLEVRNRAFRNRHQRL